MITRTLTAASVLALCAATHPHADSIVTQSIGPASYSYSGGSTGNTDLGSIILAPNTYQVNALTVTATVGDQGFGGFDPTNGVYADLFENGTLLYRMLVAPDQRPAATETYNITNNPGTLAGLDDALAGISWAADPTVSLEMDANPWTYSGWQLHVTNASLSVTSEAPEPASLTLFGAGLAGLTWLRKRKAA
jgi:hypothetical protein